MGTHFRGTCCVFYPEDGGRKYFQNIDKYLPGYTAQKTVRLGKSDVISAKFSPQQTAAWKGLRRTKIKVLERREELYAILQSIKKNSGEGNRNSIQ